MKSWAELIDEACEKFAATLLQNYLVESIDDEPRAWRRFQNGITIVTDRYVKLSQGDLPRFSKE